MPKRIRLYTDEDVQGVIVSALRLRGVDVLTTKEAGMLGASDEEQLARAGSRGRVILTHDDDFLRLHARQIQHSGIVYAHQRTPIGEVIRGLMLVHQVLDAASMRNHVEFL